MSETYFDLVIIGSGPGGYVAAIRAAQLGLKVAIVEGDAALGGTCLHRGCIPTKALLHYTEALESLAGYQEFGVNARLEGFELPKMHKAKAKTIKRMAAGIDGLMKKNKITQKNGWASIVGPKLVKVGDEIIEGKQVLLATGSKPAQLPFLAVDNKNIFTSDELLSHEETPKTMAILGAGAVGLEFACIYNALGSKVFVVEMQDRALPLEDDEISREIQALYEKRGIPIYTSTRLESAFIQGEQVQLKGINLESSTSVAYEAEAVLCAVGRIPRLDNLGLESLKIEYQGRFIKVDASYRTSLDWLYAIGDIIPGPQLAHLASAEGIVCVEGIAGYPTYPIDYGKIPSATYCRPQVASVGLSEASALEQGYQVKIGRFPWSALGKAAIVGKTEGFVKIVSEAKYGEILGVHIIGPSATDLIAEACLALSLEATVDELLHTIHAHPTLPEGLVEAAHGVFGHPLHLPPARRRSI